MEMQNFKPAEGVNLKVYIKYDEKASKYIIKCHKQEDTWA